AADAPAARHGIITQTSSRAKSILHRVVFFIRKSLLKIHVRRAVPFRSSEAQILLKAGVPRGHLPI
ncbi:MAG: hypothetical protein IKQ92_05465, partial [Clostridia bacterium]|nr:hypothetical protein [Clostridia bacterium]